MEKILYSIVTMGISFCLIVKTASTQTLEPGKEKMAKATFVNTFSHKQWATIEENKKIGFAKPKNDPEAISKVKKIAIISFEMSILRNEDVGKITDGYSSKKFLEENSFKPHLKNIQKSV